MAIVGLSAAATALFCGVGWLAPPVAHAAVLYAQTAHGGTRTYGPGTNETDPFPSYLASGGGWVTDLYVTLHLVNFGGNAKAGGITYFANYWRDFINDTATDGCWYIGTTSSDCVDPATAPAAQDLTIVAHFKNAYTATDFSWGYTITAPYTLWTDGDNGTAWTCIASTLEEAQACPVPPMLTGQNQLRADGTTPIAEGALITDGAVVFAGVPRAAPGSSLEMQIELRPVGQALTGSPTETSAAVASGAQVTIRVPDGSSGDSGIADGDYHWAARAVDLTGNSSTAWTEFGVASNTDFAIDTHPTLFKQTDESAQSSGSWYDDNWYQLGRGYAGTITSLTLKGALNCSDGDAPLIALKEFSDARYTNLVNTFPIDGNEFFNGSGFKKITFSDLTIPLDPNHYYRLDTVEGRQNCSVILKGTPGIGTAMTNMFIYGIGRVESYYAFYPYIIANGSFDEPLVIVPGVMGSSLDAAAGDTAGASPGREVWPDVTDMANSGSDDYLDALALAPDGTQITGQEMVAGDVIREATGTYNRLLIPIPISETVFGNLIKIFTDDGYTEGQDLFVAPYDWRLSIASSAAAVGAVIQNAVAHSPNGKVDIIAHSMGGLAVKKYLADAAAASGGGSPGGGTGVAMAATASAPTFVDKLILVGVPQLGAPYIFKALEYGDDLGFTFGPFSFLNPDEVKKISENMPGVYDLLPSRRYVDVDGSYVVRDVTDDAGNVTTQALNFDDTNALLTADPSDSRNASLLAAADAFHAEADGAAADTPSVYNIVGCQNPTPAQYILHDDGSIEINRANGDGSVPVDSAMNLANGYQNYFVLHSENGVDHEGLIRNAQSLALMQAIVEGTAPSLALAPLGISTDTEDCLLGRGAPRPAMVEVSVAGSSTVDVYDADGNHTGTNDAGDSEAKIPGSSYDTIGGNKFITLPASSTYKVTIKQASSSLSSTKAKVKVKKYDTTVHVTTSTTYSDVPLASASSTATLTLAAPPSTSATSTPDPVLVVDDDDTGATSTVIAPDSPGGAPPVHIPLVCATVTQ